VYIIFGKNINEVLIKQSREEVRKEGECMRKEYAGLHVG